MKVTAPAEIKFCLDSMTQTASTNKLQVDLDDDGMDLCQRTHFLFLEVVHSPFLRIFEDIVK